MKPYASYSDTGIDWIGEVPSGWRIVPMKYVAHIKYGLGQPPKAKPDGLPIIRATNVERGKLNLDNLLLVDPNDVPYERDPILKENDIIVVRSGAYTADSAIIPAEFEGAIAGYDMVMRAHDIDPKLLAYALLSPYLRENQLFLKRSRAAQPHLNAEELGESLVIVPPANEQHKIAAYLDHTTALIDQLIAKNEQLVTLLDDQRKAIINEAVTKGLDPKVPMKDSGIGWLGMVPKHWRITSLRHLATKIGSGVTPRGGAAVYTEQGVAFIRSQNVHFDGLRLDNVQYIPVTVHEQMSGTHVQKDDVLLNITGASIGRCCLVELDQVMNVNQHVCIIRATGEILAKYLNLVMQSDVGQTQIRLGITGGNREGLNMEQLKEFSIPVPSTEEQEGIAKSVEEKLVTLKDIQERTLEVIENLKLYRASVISEAVTGKIDLREWEPAAMSLER